MCAAKLRKGDNVIVKCGDDKGKVGKIQRVLPGKNKLLVENVNMHKKHIKRTDNQPGTIVEKEFFIDRSNVMYAIKNDKDQWVGTRIRIVKESKKVKDSKANKKYNIIRYSVKDNKPIE